ncbi:Helicase [hydrothermal vent metagenome]|uniref:Helicase n=1 Tax=hydrothermal vent metagenome TaxID=652676 RepID=A0A1W1CYV9_9ZZZZ
MKKARKGIERYKQLSFENLYYGTQRDLLALEEEGEDDLSAINFGLALHYTLEMMDSFCVEALPNALNMMLNKYGFALSDAEIAEIEKRVKNLVQNEQFLALTNGKIFKEKALRFKNNLRYLDLLVKKEDGSYSIIDYKSSFNFSEKHLAQVRYYVNAVKAITGEQSVSGYLCYIVEDGIKFVKV